MVQRLRSNFIGANKPKIITIVPQCIVPDANMGGMITNTQFDIIWVQYYNTPQCSARNWANANPNYLLTGIEAASSFSYDTWADFISGTASANAKLYIGLPGAPATADPSSNFYLNTTEMSSLVKAYHCKENFGGIMIWEATEAENNVGPNGTLYQDVKDILLGYETDSLLCSISSGNNTSRKRIPATRMVTAPFTLTKLTQRNPN